MEDQMGAAVTPRAEPSDRAPVDDLALRTFRYGRSQPVTPASYVLTGVPALDELLARADRVTRGRGGLVQRGVSYLFVGGFAAVVNLASFFVLVSVVRLPIAKNLHWLMAFVIAAEISTMTNFAINDHITFSRLPGHARAWWARCLRFHSTSLAGTLVTLAVSFALATWAGLYPVLAQAAAIVVALTVNFTLHHVWTYRRIADAH
ncbi:MAG TPA: GtrA family protein [Ktedonobacterales bacterium]|nr:GtrA family protein [Ktedonobacterales bacterium]